MQLVKYFSLSKQIKNNFFKKHLSQKSIIKLPKPIFCLLAEFSCSCDEQIGTQSSSIEAWLQQFGCLCSHTGTVTPPHIRSTSCLSPSPPMRAEIRYDYFMDKF